MPDMVREERYDAKRREIERSPITTRVRQLGFKHPRLTQEEVDAAFREYDNVWDDCIYSRGRSFYDLLIERGIAPDPQTGRYRKQTSLPPILLKEGD